MYYRDDKAYNISRMLKLREERDELKEELNNLSQGFFSRFMNSGRIRELKQQIQVLQLQMIDLERRLSR